MRNKLVMAKELYSKLISLCTLACCVVLMSSSISNAQDIVRIRTRSVTGNLANPVANNVFTPAQASALGIQGGSEFFCGGSMINIPFEVENVNNGRLLSDNVFMAEVSEPNGQFLPENSPNRRIFGMLPGRTSGTIYARLPNNLPFGTNYRVRIIANRPRLTTSIESVPNQTDSTRNYNLVVFPKPCFSAETKAVNCFSNLTIRVNPNCSYGRCDCPGTDPNIPIYNQGFYNVELVDYPVRPQDVRFNYNTFTYEYSNLPTGWYQIRVSDLYGCDSTLNFYHVASPTSPISSLLLSDIQDDEATVSWGGINNPINEGTTTYELRYRVVEENFPDTTSVPFPSPNTHANWTQVNNIFTTSLTLTPLQPNTRYEVQVRAICFDPALRRVESPWSASKFFDTRQIATPVPSDCRQPGGLYVRYTNTSDGSLINNGRVFWNLDPNNVATCYEMQYGPVFNNDNDPLRVALDWSHPSYVSRHFNNQRFLLPSQIPGGVPVVVRPDYNPGRLMRVRVRANCSLRCAETQMNLSDWSNAILFRLPLPRFGAQASDASFSVYPNPSHGNFNVVFNSDIVAPTTVIVMDMMGKVVYEQNGEANIGENNVAVDLGSNAKGIYILQVAQGGVMHSARVLVD